MKFDILFVGKMEHYTSKDIKTSVYLAATVKCVHKLNGGRSSVGSFFIKFNNEIGVISYHSYMGDFSFKRG